MFTFKGNDAMRYRTVSHRGACLTFGGCVPDPTNTVITKTIHGGSGSCAESIYFMCCDGKYRNALRRVLGQAGGKETVNKETQAYRDLMERIETLDKSHYGKFDSPDLVDHALTSLQKSRNPGSAHDSAWTTRKVQG